MDSQLDAIIDHAVYHVQSSHTETKHVKKRLKNTLLEPGTSFLEQGKLQCCLLITLLKVNRPTEELEVAHDVLVVHDHLAGWQQSDLPVVVLEAATAKRSRVPQSLKEVRVVVFQVIAWSNIRKPA